MRHAPGMAVLIESREVRLILELSWKGILSPARSTWPESDGE